MFQAKFDQAKYLTLGVGAVNVTFTLVAVSTKCCGNPPYFPYTVVLWKTIITYNIMIITTQQNALQRNKKRFDV